MVLSKLDLKTKILWIEDDFEIKARRKMSVEEKIYAYCNVIIGGGPTPLRLPSSCWSTALLAYYLESSVSVRHPYPEKKYIDILFSQQ